MMAARLLGAAIGIVLGPIVVCLMFFPFIFVDWSSSQFAFAAVFCGGCLGASILGGIVGLLVAARWAEESRLKTSYRLSTLLLATTILGVFLGLTRQWGPAAGVFFLFFTAAILRSMSVRQIWRGSFFAGAVTGFIILGILGPTIRFLPHLDGYTHQAPHFFWLIFDLPAYGVIGVLGGGLLGTAVWAASYALRAPLQISLLRILACVGASVCVCVVVMSLPCSASLPGELVEAALMQTDTAYSAGYTHLRWKTVRLGMTPNEVTDLIGQPFDKWWRQDLGEFWSYSRSPADTHYFTRQLVFRDGSVVEVDSSLYYD